MNENEPIPARNVRRRRNPGMLVPGTVPGVGAFGARAMTPEEWQADQDHKQALHAKGWIEARKREIAEREATNRALDAEQGKPVGHGLKTMSEEIDGVAERLIVPPSPDDVRQSRAKPLRAPARGPKMESGKVVDEGEVPVKRHRTKKVSRVGEVRKKARLAKVLG
jgi:hypothetical protein